MLPSVTGALSAPLNGLLLRNPWATLRLGAFVGKTAELRIFPGIFRLTVTDDGLLQPAPAELTADTVIALTPALALRILAGDDKALREATIEGDSAFGQEIAYLTQHLNWDFEEDLSRLFGDVIAHRIGQTARNLNRWRVEAGRSLAENFRDYWVQERPLLAAREAVDDFNGSVDQLRDDLERLEKRIERLTR
ncbi:MAG: hypothetical protein H0U63_03800 [Burkholderiales bacterium]|nr:hypothetical protein [Burkholderiales bacterium]